MCSVYSVFTANAVIEQWLLKCSLTYGVIAFFSPGTSLESLDVNTGQFTLFSLQVHSMLNSDSLCI